MEDWLKYCGGDEKSDCPRRTDKSRTLKTFFKRLGASVPTRDLFHIREFIVQVKMCISKVGPL